MNGWLWAAVAAALITGLAVGLRLGGWLTRR